MKNFRATRIAFVLLAACAAVIVFVAPGGTSVRATNERRAASNIRVAPPAPVFSDKERVAELMQRRNRVADWVGTKSFMVLFSTEQRIYSNSVNYPYRQENNLYYLTNLKQQGATLVLLPGNTKHKEILFLPRRIASREAWDGHMYTPEEAYQLSGVREIWQNSEFEPFIRALRTRQPYRPKQENIFMSDLPPNTPLSNDNGFATLFEAAGKGEAGLVMLVPGAPENREFRHEQRFAAEWGTTASGYGIRNAWPIFTEMRLVKSPMELRLMQHAIEISIEAHQRSWVSAINVKW